MTDYKVGYGKPPKKHCFKKGQSGNPKGRPKISNDLKDILNEVTDEKVLINEGGKKREITKFRAAITQQMNQAAKGDLKALQYISNLHLQLNHKEILEKEKAPLPWNDD